MAKPVVIIVPTRLLERYRPRLCDLLEDPGVPIPVGSRFFWRCGMYGAWLIEDCIQLRSAIVTSHPILFVNVRTLPTGLVLYLPGSIIRDVTDATFGLSATADALASTGYLG